MTYLYCDHGEAFPFDSAGEAAAHAICGYCCTPYPRGAYREHCASSPSHLGELEARAQDRENAHDRERYGHLLGGSRH